MEQGWWMLPVPIGGRNFLPFGEGSIYYAWSDDLLHSTPGPQDEPIMVPMVDTFTSFQVGPPPVVLDIGLILLVHNAPVKNEDGTVRYTRGQLLYCWDRPTEILAEVTRPWLEPSTVEDTTGSSSSRGGGSPIAGRATPPSAW